ncbi:sensor histidine kinase [Paenibacillus xerothermodurans]|uniref:histidine kinase n=1 Tax=Paenibacillus xerothermodurans TaxID=1977292 RepID=A0A2W1P1I9_PAEXE|nr:sensor histidine kinase [Paenibacillus xerothermodurans]PZE21612.1 sensor histidine kinase [Paenibacillus xerothermodurans]
MRQTTTIRAQMVGFFSVLLTIPLLISAIYIYLTLQSNLKQNHIRHQSQTVQVLSVEIGEWRQAYENLSLRIFGDPLVQHILKIEQWQQTAQHLSLRSELRDRLISYAETTDNCRAIYVMDSSFNSYGTKPDAAMFEYMQSKRDTADRLDGYPAWSSEWIDQTIVLYRRINDNQYDLNHGIGYLFIVLDRQELLSIYEQFTLERGQQFALTDFWGIRISTSDRSIVKAMTGVDGAGHATSYGIVQLDDGKHAYTAVRNQDWQLTTWVAEEEIYAPIRPILVAVIFVSVALIVYSVMMVVFISNRITRPLRVVQNAMKQVGGGLLGLKVPVMRHDEVGQLAATLNRMSDEIVALVEKNREEEAKLRRLQLRTLEYQINPHFLYNALDSVNMLARKYDDRRIADIVTSLSRLFRIGLNQGKELISVHDEIQHVSYYLKIQGIRFGDQLRWDVNMDQTISSCGMIKFLLQPLVENSINHGIRKSGRPGFVAVSAVLDSNHIVLTVKDNGAGMPEQQVEAVRNLLSLEDGDINLMHLKSKASNSLHELSDVQAHLGNSGGGFGLRNVHQRIQLHYGASYGLTVESEYGRGTVIRVRLPLQQGAGSAAEGIANI